MSEAETTQTTSTSKSLEEIFTDLLEKDGKQRIGSYSTPAFLAATLIGMPMYFGVVLPLAIVTTLGKKVMSSSSPIPLKLSGFDDDEKFPKLSEIKPMKDRKYDLVYLGATGFAGKLALEHLSKTYGVNKDVKFAIAGRSTEKLEKVKKEVAELIGDTSVLNVPTIIVDTSKRDTMHALVNDAKCVASSAGPFYLYGSNVVEFCAKYGTHYVDITGEVDWVKTMIMKWDEKAQETGAKLVSCCGCDSIPWDLSVYKMAQLLKSNDDELVEVNCYNDMKGGGPSGGTLATMLINLDGKTTHPKYDINPLLKLPDGSKSAAKTKLLPILIPGSVSAEDVGSSLSMKGESPFVMSAVNCEIIKRTQALTNKSSASSTSLKFRDVLLFKDFKTAFMNWFILVAGGTLIFTPFRNSVILKPGEGPTRKMMDDGYLAVFGYGKGTKGNIVESLLYYPNEVGYKDTARMLVESGLTLALDGEKMPVKNGGCYSPAFCMGDALLDRLSVGGTKFFSRVFPENMQSKL